MTFMRLLIVLCSLLFCITSSTVIAQSSIQTTNDHARNPELRTRDTSGFQSTYRRIRDAEPNFQLIRITFERDNDDSGRPHIFIAMWLVKGYRQPGVNVELIKAFVTNNGELFDNPENPQPWKKFAATLDDMNLLRTLRPFTIADMHGLDIRTALSRLWNNPGLLPPSARPNSWREADVTFPLRPLPPLAPQVVYTFYLHAQALYLGPFNPPMELYVGCNPPSQHNPQISHEILPFSFGPRSSPFGPH